MRAILAALMAALTFAPWIVSACDFMPVRIEGSIGKVGNVTIELGESIGKPTPTAWQGPMTISIAAAPACTVSDDVSIVEGPIALAGGILYVPTYSGSTSIVYAVEAKTCAVIWRSKDYEGAAAFKPGRLITGTKAIPVDRRCRPMSRSAM
ncbi:hypothetical protein [Trinickia symbiotica]|nr:hypothetical protein [Trinickia symbiotica]